jgi:hypothetical protein
MKALVCAAMSILASCHKPVVPAHYLTQHWKPGITVRYSLVTADSGFVHIEDSMDEDSLVRSADSAYQVQLTVSDTADGPLIEWKQFLPGSITSTDTVFDELLYKVLYRCDRRGRFSKIMNADDIKARCDSMLLVYWREAGGDSMLLRPILATNDAQSYAQQFSQSLERFHSLYGAEVFAGDTMFAMAQDLDSAVMRSRFNYALPDAREHCSPGTVAFRSWATSSDTMDLMQEVLFLPLSVNDQAWGSMQNDIELCMDTVTWLPQRYLFKRTSLAGKTKVVRTMAMKRLE